MLAPIITIDGPAASGKGTVAALVASRLAYHYLDSGSLYRLVALCAVRQGVALDDEKLMSQLASYLLVYFDGDKIILNGEEASEAIRTDEVAENASRIAALPAVRTALLERQRAFRQPPGLVADGRDMGSVVFPQATLKVFLTASVDIRAERRYKQLIGKGESASMHRIKQALAQRDERDAARPLAPLQQQADALLLDTSALTISQAVDQVLSWFGEKGVGAS